MKGYELETGIDYIVSYVIVWNVGEREWGHAHVAVRDVKCEVYSRTFRRLNDKARHSVSMEESKKPFREQQLRCNPMFKVFQMVPE